MFVCICLEELWILDLISIPVHSVAAVLDPIVCATIHVFHAFTGFDTTSSVLILKYTCTDFRGTILKEYTKALKFGGIVGA